MRKLIVANYKMNGNKEFFHNVQKNIEKSKDTEIVLCPPFVYLSCFKNSSGYHLGAQNVSCEVKGKRTGDISAEMLKDVGVQYCIVGHSERNQPYNTDEIVAKKVQNCIKNNIIPIICFGEEIENCLDDLNFVINNSIKYVKNCEVVFAYEPVWAIGTGKTATVDIVNKVADLVGKICATKQIEFKFIYGGSVNLQNYKKFKNANINGFMLGKLSLDINKLNEFLKGI